MILPLVDATEDVKEPQSTVPVATVVFAVIGWIMVITVVTDSSSGHCCWCVVLETSECKEIPL